MEEELIKRSPRGQVLGVLLGYMQSMDYGCFASVAVTLITECKTCILAGKRHRLPSLSHAAVWSAFHSLRLREDILYAWNVFVDANVPASHQLETNLALQVILDRSLKAMIGIKAKQLQSKSVGESVRPALTFIEQRSEVHVRLRCSEVATRRHRRNAALGKKYRLFVRILDRMKATEQPGEPDSPSEYSTLWSELVDRGGLYNVNHSVFNLVESIELMVRQKLNIPDVQASSWYRQPIREGVLSDHPILICWETITEGVIPPKFEAYSLELLANITDLWITIRGHSFAKGWTMNFERKFKKGTRKSLKPTDNTFPLALPIVV